MVEAHQGKGSLIMSAAQRLLLQMRAERALLGGLLLPDCLGLPPAIAREARPPGLACPQLRAKRAVDSVRPRGIGSQIHRAQGKSSKELLVSRSQDASEPIWL